MTEEALFGDGAARSRSQSSSTNSLSTAPEQGIPAVGPARLISSDPIIISTPGSGRDPIGIAEGLGRVIAQRPATFLSPLAWRCTEAIAARKAVAARSYMARYPRHELIFLGNTQQETTWLAAAGATAFFANHNMYASEDVFLPLPAVPIEFDAIYNARPTAIKRHWLSAEIGRVAYVGLVTVGEEETSRAITAEVLSRGPGHIFINQIVDGLPLPLSRPAVNSALARAAVGLCLSEVEAAQHASIEYLLAGLPVVATPSPGGRDLFFDSDYCIIAEPEPRAVREAVEILRDRKIPRAYVRARTLAKLAVERNRFLAFLEDIKARRGVPRAYSTEWTLSGAPFHRWARTEQHASDLLRRLGQPGG